MITSLQKYSNNVRYYSQQNIVPIQSCVLQLAVYMIMQYRHNSNNQKIEFAVRV